MLCVTVPLLAFGPWNCEDVCEPCAAATPAPKPSAVTTRATNITFKILDILIANLFLLSFRTVPNFLKEPCACSWDTSVFRRFQRETKIIEFSLCDQAWTSASHPCSGRNGACMNSGRENISISCQEVRRELANYMEDDVSDELRKRMERHFVDCKGCQATYDSLRNVIRLMADGEILELPEGFSRRLFARIASM